MAGHGELVGEGKEGEGGGERGRSCGVPWRGLREGGAWGPVLLLRSVLCSVSEEELNVRNKKRRKERRKRKGRKRKERKRKRKRKNMENFPNLKIFVEKNKI
jgi:hypothetical protein